MKSHCNIGKLHKIDKISLKFVQDSTEIFGNNIIEDKNDGGFIHGKSVSQHT
jgi:hypothetical protein